MILKASESTFMNYGYLQELLKSYRWVKAVKIWIDLWKSRVKYFEGSELRF